jgi:hypothetical protein
MKRAFFSFIAITLVALVLFVASAYLFTFKDMRNMAQTDLEIRRVAERTDDVLIAINRTILDAIDDAAYTTYGCEVASPNSEDFCSKFNPSNNLMAIYLDNLSSSFSDSIAVNISETELVYCGILPNSSFSAWGFNIAQTNFTRQINESILVEIKSQNVVWQKQLKFFMQAEVINQYVVAWRMFIIRTTGINIANSTNPDNVLGVWCD